MRTSFEKDAMNQKVGRCKVRRMGGKVKRVDGIGHVKKLKCVGSEDVGWVIEEEI